MSLLFHRRAIARAVSGELEEADERRLRAHLRGCQACRAYYDDLALAAEAFAAAAPAARDAAAPDHRANLAAAREQARLMAALPTGSSPTTAEARARLTGLSRPAWAATLLVPAALAVWFLLRPAPRSAEIPEGDPGSAEVADAPGVAWRGSRVPGDDLAPTAGLLIYAGRPSDGGTSAGAHVRLVADLPGSGEGRVSAGDFVQFVLRGLQTCAYVMVLGVGDAGDVHVYVPRAGTPAARYEPSAAGRSLGPSVNLGAAGHRPGRLRLYALLSPTPLDEARARAAAARLDRSRPGAPPLDLPVPQVSGVLALEP
jgi:hypothetical protein